MLRLTASYAGGWNVSSIGFHQYRQLVAEFDRACAEVGRDPAAVRRSRCGGCICAPTQAQAEQLAGVARVECGVRNGVGNGRLMS